MTGPTAIAPPSVTEGSFNVYALGMPTVEAIAKMLAGEHMQDDPSIVSVFWAPHENEVRLVEVSSSISDKGEVLPFRFTPDPPGVPYPSVMILLSPGDWDKRFDLNWPDGFEKLEKISGN